MPRRQGFVGREGELAAVLGLIADAADDQPGVALIQGEAGAGKTRLLDEVLSRLLPELGVRREGPSDQARLIAAVSSLLDRAAAIRPTVLVLDDLHCADVA